MKITSLFDFIDNNDISRKINDILETKSDENSTSSTGAFPVSSYRIGYDKYILLTKNKYNTRQFSSKFKLYVNNEFNISSPNGVYTWILVYYNDMIVFLCTQAYNKLEIHSKHSFLLEKFENILNEFSYKRIGIHAKIVCSGELEKQDDIIKYNFMSGTYMVEVILTEEVNVMNYIFNILGFENNKYIDEIKTFIDDTITDAFLKSIPGGTFIYIVDFNMLTKINPITESKLLYNLSFNENMIKRYGQKEELKKERENINNQLKDIEQAKRSLSQFRIFRC